MNGGLVLCTNKIFAKASMMWQNIIRCNNERLIIIEKT
ncbi:hypothetical protein Dtox_2333 [Desulfofarcimen acetoxidans DSM 771]|uniref:Uncharacterized protein n=1 Tax=Desulfofarcimen acetoxidans (strain ATCC 49208 / DSM 771 / KCTC 5769 / VKM B-1644 / 5575) TaxID=485916 RepID=C8W091_DESAS|nr:hypothetical protein Dtox_2333 [Desulfofarcimen acetoxidans DSM 771]